MSGYGPFARYYDDLTQNVGYEKRARALCRLLGEYSSGRDRPGLILDLACGTGSLSLELARMGCDVVGADASAGMLSVAAQKSAGYDILFLRQSMTKLDLYGTVDATVCILDSLNHLESERELLAVFKRVALFTGPGGLFIFDVNTLYKHREVMGSNVFVYETPRVWCCWQNTFNPVGGRVDITLDFFENRGNDRYVRESESFSEWFYGDKTLLGLLAQAGFTHITTMDGDSFGPALETSQRLLYVTRRG